MRDLKCTRVSTDAGSDPERPLAKHFFRYFTYAFSGVLPISFVCLRFGSVFFLHLVQLGGIEPPVDSRINIPFPATFPSCLWNRSDSISHLLAALADALVLQALMPPDLPAYTAGAKKQIQLVLVSPGLLAHTLKLDCSLGGSAPPDPPK